MNDSFDDAPEPGDTPGRQSPDWDRPPRRRSEVDDGAEPVAPADLTECWRCGKLGFPDTETCVYCRASLGRRRPGRRKGRPPEGVAATPVVRMLWLFGAFLLTSVIFGAVIRFGFDPSKFEGEREARHTLYLSLVVEGVDTALVVCGIFWLGRLAWRRPSTAVRVAGWSMAPGILALLLTLNYAYMHLLRSILQIPTMEQGLVAHKDLLWLIILVVCVQPAVVEELFFRYLALGALRRVTGTSAAVLISSVMFGMAHVFNPLGIPYLIVAGMVFGYFRVASGRIILPMLLHFGHNLAVVFLFK